MGCGKAGEEERPLPPTNGPREEERSVASGCRRWGGYMGCGSAREEEGFTADGTPYGRRRGGPCSCAAIRGGYVLLRRLLEGGERSRRLTHEPQGGGRVPALSLGGILDWEEE